MQKTRRGFADRPSARLLCRTLLSLVAFTPLPSAMAQQAAPMSPSVVLVLKLVSSTLVKPTTGIVVSDDGMVLVPAGFAAQEGEMIVLDGGADIASNGRPARLVEADVSGGLALLSVKGLKRPGISFSGNFEETAGALHLAAFPPAEEIAKGAQPLSKPVNFSLDRQAGRYVVSPDTPLPYVTGAILDGCGGLAGVSLASGPQSLDSGKPTTVLLGAGLRKLLDSMQIALPSANCERQEKKAAAPVATTGRTSEPAGAKPSTEPAAPAVQESADQANTAGTAAKAPAEPPPQETLTVKAEQRTVTRAPEPRSIWRHVPAWLWLSAFVIAGIVAWKAVYLLRLRPHSPATHDGPNPAGVQPASDEPDTAPLEDAASARPRSAPVMDFDIPATASRPAGCDGLLLVEGWLDADTPFKRFCFVDSSRVDVVIGRGDADIAIEHAAISRHHARIRSDGGHLTISDMGSKNGSFIGEAPCLPGEVMYLDPGAEIFLGDVKMIIAIVEQEAEWA